MSLLKLFFAGCLTLIVFAVDAQTVKVKKEKNLVKGETMEGFEVELTGSLAEVNNAFLKLTKSLGKVKQSDGITINEPNVNGLAYTQPLFGLVRESGVNSVAWIGLSEKQWKKEDADKVKKELEKIMQDFGVRFYRDKIQHQIDESQRALQAVEKQQQRLLNENKNLHTKVEDNKREKLALEKAIENNKTELQTLLLKIDNNKKAQDSVAQVADQIKKLMEGQRDKQRKVN